MRQNHAPTTADEYTDWINRNIGLEVRRRREALGLSAYALAHEAGVSDQTLLNLEQGWLKKGCMSGTLIRIARRLGLRLSELVSATEEAAEMPILIG